MNKKAIWLIIGLMSAAVIGVVWLQIDLIRTAARVNEERFEKNVYNALNAVAARLEKEESKEVEKFLYSGFAKNFLQRQISGTESSILSLDIGVSGNPLSALNGQENLSKLFKDLTNACPYCLKEREINYRQIVSNQSFSQRLLEERINLQFLDEVLEQELTNRGINIDYNYGVLSKKKKSFVIMDGHYAVEDNQTNMIMPGYENITMPKYKVSLFTKDVPPPGLLVLHFPNKNSFVWESLFYNLLGSLLLAAIILCCFGYTVHVIFRQKKLSEMKTDFINNMTHEFKTPIATISLAADSITSPMLAGKPEKVQRFANIIQQENKRMNSQVEKVLQMAQIDKRDFSLKVTEINLHEVIARAVENISLQVEKKDGVVKTDLQASNPMVEGDLTHVSNMINNLLDNANKYSPDNPEITVLTRNVPNGVEVIIQDKGVGMTKDVRKHIFDKFYRVHTGDLHDVKGFGLGLSYVKAMITAHKGQIEVKSEVGKGSSFILTFPFYVNNN
jgi:two-component system phosphate regulon sensor histidine kinase PhoR